ncbi:MAG: DUF2061 domain-containing protein [Rhodospirillaceae bacterium]
MLYNRYRGWRRVVALICAAFLCFAAAPFSNCSAEPIGLEVVSAGTNAPPAPGPFAGVEPTLLSLYKTMTYTATVLTTDQIWYMGMAEKAADTGGIFGVVNIITSPMLTYTFEYAWEKCCELPPGPEGVRPLDPYKAFIYRIISMTRTFTLAMLFGNELEASLLITGAISATRTIAYMTNDMIWNRLTASGYPALSVLSQR